MITVKASSKTFAPEVGSVLDGERYKYSRRDSHLIARFSRDALFPARNSN